MPVQTPQSRLWHTIFSALLIAMLHGCSADGPNRPDPEARNHPTESAALKACRQALADHNPVIVAHIGAMQLTVRMATTADLPEDNSNGMRFLMAEGGGSLALGLVAPPMYASALVVGGVLLIPLGTYIYIHDKNIWDSICDTFGSVEFTRAIVDSFQRRLLEKSAEAKRPRADVEIIVEAYGIAAPPSGGRSCLLAVANFVCRQEGRIIKQERLQIADGHRSEDAPPPQCATLEQFTEDDARLMKTTLAEYAEVLAVMAIDRIAE
jgi:hypothetical protein